MKGHACQYADHGVEEAHVPFDLGFDLRRDATKECSSPWTAPAACVNSAELPGILIAVLPPTFTPSCPLEVEIGELCDDLYIHGTTVTACVFLRQADAHDTLVRADSSLTATKGASHATGCAACTVGV